MECDSLIKLIDGMASEFLFLEIREIDVPTAGKLLNNLDNLIKEADALKIGQLKRVACGLSSLLEKIVLERIEDEQAGFGAFEKGIILMQEIGDSLKNTGGYEGDIESFMEGYIKSDNLKFVGSKGITHGWKQTLENYKKSYPGKEHMGILTFNLLEFDQLAKDVFLVIGEFHLKRTVGDANGMFSIILKQIDSKWRIIADHSS